jgi:formylglycine-generating enzyme required for sulfatase activity
MSGQVLEWCQNSHRAYPQVADVAQKDFTTSSYDVPLRGGSWYKNRTYIRCGARVRHVPVFGFTDDDELGFRVVAVPRLAQMS